jgi:hypothetical protein
MVFTHHSSTPAPALADGIKPQNRPRGNRNQKMRNPGRLCRPTEVDRANFIQYQTSSAKWPRHLGFVQLFFFGPEQAWPANIFYLAADVKGFVSREANR